MPSHFGPPSFEASGNFGRGDRLADDAAGRDVDHEQRRVLVVRHEDAMAIADRLDARGLDDQIHLSRAVQERSGERGALQAEVVGPSDGRGRGDQAGEHHEAKRTGQARSHGGCLPGIFV